MRLELLPKREARGLSLPGAQVTSDVYYEHDGYSVVDLIEMHGESFVS